MAFDLSIIVSNYKRLDLFKRTLYSLNHSNINFLWELVIADEISDESDLLIKEMEKYTFPWTIVQCDYAVFEKITKFPKTGNPAWTNNVAFKHSSGSLIGLLGNDIILDTDAVSYVTERAKNIGVEDYIVYATTYDLFETVTKGIGEYGEKFDNSHKTKAYRYPILHETIKTGVTNHLSVSPRGTWIKVNGYDEQCCLGLAADDSIFVKRVAAIPNSKTVICSEAITFHQYHGGISQYYNHIKDIDRWNRLVPINRTYYHSIPDTEIKNPQSWPIGYSDGFRIIKNW